MPVAQEFAKIKNVAVCAYGKCNDAAEPFLILLLRIPPPLSAQDAPQAPLFRLSAYSHELCDTQNLRVYGTKNPASPVQKPRVSCSKPPRLLFTRCLHHGRLKWTEEERFAGGAGGAGGGTGGSRVVLRVEGAVIVRTVAPGPGPGTVAYAQRTLIANSCTAAIILPLRRSPLQLLLACP